MLFFTLFTIAAAIIMTVSTYKTIYPMIVALKQADPEWKMKPTFRAVYYIGNKITTRTR